MKGALILGLVAAALLAFILVFERGTVSTGELEARAPAVLQRFVRDRVSRLEIQRRGVTTILQRVPDPELGDDATVWRLEAPMEGPADQAAVDTLLGELEWMDSRRRIEGVTSSDRARFGLDNPRYRVWFTVGSERLLLRVGSQTPVGDAVYAEGDRPDVVFVVGKDLPEALDHDPAHYHGKALHGGLSLLSTESIVLRGEDGEVRVEKREGRFRIVAPTEGLVSREALSEVVRTIDNLEAARFVSATVEDAGAIGMDAPVFELLLDKHTALDETGAEGKPKMTRTELRFRLGAPCADHDGESHLAIDDGPVFCVVDAELAGARKSLAELREDRLLVLDDDQIDAVRIHAGKVETELWAKEGEDGSRTWSLRQVTAGDIASFSADTRAISDWLAELRAQTVDAFEQGDATGPLAGARVQVTFDRSGDGPDYTVAVLADGLVRRGGEPQQVRFTQDVAALLSPPAVRFRDPTVWPAPKSALSELELRRGERVETVRRRDDGVFRLSSDDDADASTLQDLGRMLSPLRAVRYVADQAGPEHGLATPDVRMRARFGEEERTLELGAAVGAARFARAGGDPAVFLVSSAIVGALTQPLVDRGLAAVPADAINRIEVARGDARCTVRPPDEAKEGDAEATIARDTIQALASLRAATVSEGAAPPAEVWASLVVHTDSGPVTLQIGPPEGPDGRRLHPLVMVDQLDYTFGIADTVATALTGCAATEANAPPP